jgi:maltose alpha-D-glucosyltransferase/alpha-amylase
MKSPQERQTLPEDYHAVHLMMMQTLGRRTGEMHVALARESGDPAFDPEPIRPQDLDTWTGNIRNEALQTLDKLEGRRDSLTATAQAIVNHLLGARDTILERITAHKSMDVQALKTRYHGDYHLGQVLVVHNDFLIIDFEGEPARPLAERRLKHSPLKDVAGMLRSFNYAAYAALYAMTSERPDDFPLLEPFARDWERQTRQAFMAGYEEAVKGCPVYPQDPDTAQRLIDLFGVEKALYELRYELDNRPAWVGVPLGGLLELFG